MRDGRWGLRDQSILQFFCLFILLYLFSRFCRRSSRNGSPFTTHVSDIVSRNKKLMKNTQSVTPFQNSKKEINKECRRETLSIPMVESGYSTVFTTLQVIVLVLMSRVYNVSYKSEFRETTGPVRERRNKSGYKNQSRS